MGTVRVKTIQQMIRANNQFVKRNHTAQDKILSRLARTNHQVSTKIAETVTYTGTLVSGINVVKEADYEYLVISSAPYSAEIEEGLQGKTRKWEAPVSVLDAWRDRKAQLLGMKSVGTKGKSYVTVGDSPNNGSPHPKGLHFMFFGWQSAVNASDGIVNQELTKLRR